MLDNRKAIYENLYLYKDDFASLWGIPSEYAPNIELELPEAHEAHAAAPNAGCFIS
ncbi:MAG: hypothetical protein K2Q14_00835 [Gammaproteobacteria bacterium]|nr:hypothetical protein [Gammaproteobacteria bacterium]